jgi:hypothetical protein
MINRHATGAPLQQDFRRRRSRRFAEDARLAHLLCFLPGGGGIQLLTYAHSGRADEWAQTANLHVAGELLKSRESDPSCFPLLLVRSTLPAATRSKRTSCALSVSSVQNPS